MCCGRTLSPQVVQHFGWLRGLTGSGSVDAIGHAIGLAVALLLLLAPMSLRSARWLIAALTVVATASAVPARPALASPHVYSNFVTGVDTLDECLSRARRTARSTGFTVGQQVVNLRAGKGAEFFADHASEPMAVNVHCVPRTGTVSIAVAGMNNDRTFEAMREFYNEY